MGSQSPVALPLTSTTDPYPESPEPSGVKSYISNSSSAVYSSKIVVVVSPTDALATTPVPNLSGSIKETCGGIA